MARPAAQRWLLYFALYWRDRPRNDSWTCNVSCEGCEQLESHLLCPVCSDGSPRKLLGNGYDVVNSFERASAADGRWLRDIGAPLASPLRLARYRGFLDLLATKASVSGGASLAKADKQPESCKAAALEKDLATNKAVSSQN